MRNNDMISRVDVLEFFDEFIATYSDGFIAIAGDQKEEMTAADMAQLVTSVAVSFRNAIDQFLPAEQPMSAVEYLYQRERMKAEMGFPFCIPDKEKMRACVAVVEKWGQEHPERSEEE